MNTSYHTFLSLVRVCLSSLQSVPDSSRTTRVFATREAADASAATVNVSRLALVIAGRFAELRPATAGHTPVTQAASDYIMSLKGAEFDYATALWHGTTDGLTEWRSRYIQRHSTTLERMRVIRSTIESLSRDGSTPTRPVRLLNRQRQTHTGCESQWMRLDIIVRDSSLP
jgi:hypothetical protein